MNTPVQKLIAAATQWAAFQEGDSLLDQETDERLKWEATEAREHLLDVINEHFASPVIR